MSFFRFKQFTIQQDQCAMKVGTDGVLLGAWNEHPQPHQILDIGSGTGLIALMCAQRYPQAKITGIEPDKNAFEQALDNITNSKFNKQVTLKNCRLQSFNPVEEFDLIICNPPYFKEQTLAKNDARERARHSKHLPLSDLISFAEQQLSPEGILSLILPSNRLNEIQSNTLHLRRLTHIRGHADAPVKRVLADFVRYQTKLKSTELIIELDRHQYTPAYRKLTGEFYLNF